jgi:hypothetical protein
LKQDVRESQVAHTFSQLHSPNLHNKVRDVFGCLAKSDEVIRRRAILRT